MSENHLAHGKVQYCGMVLFFLDERKPSPFGSRQRPSSLVFKPTSFLLRSHLSSSHRGNFATSSLSPYDCDLRPSESDLLLSLGVATASVLLFIPYKRRLAHMEFNTSASSAPGHHTVAELPLIPLLVSWTAARMGARLSTPLKSSNDTAEACDSFKYYTN